MRTREWELVPSKGQSEESIEADIAQIHAHSDELLARGVREWRSHYRWIGPVKVMRYKEVGPPPWRWPKLVVQGARDPLCVSVKVGWRSTAYAVVVLQARP